MTCHNSQLKKKQALITHPQPPPIQGMGWLVSQLLPTHHVKKGKPYLQDGSDYT